MVSLRRERSAAVASALDFNLCNLWFRLQGFGVRGRECATYETLPCNLKAKLANFFREQPAGQKDDTEQGVNAVIDLAKVQRSYHPRAVWRGAQPEPQNTQRKINDTKYK